MKIEILKGFTMRDVETGELVSYRKSAIITVDDTLGEALINDGFAKEDKRVVPMGTITITENASDINIEQYAKADVDVPSDVPEGTAYIRKTGTYDISKYANANVSIMPVNVIFHLNGGTCNLLQDGDNVVFRAGLKGTDIMAYIDELNIVPPQNKVFGGWCTSDDGTGEFIRNSYETFLYNVISDIELYAMYGDEATISFENNGCSGSIRPRNGAVGYPTVNLDMLDEFLDPPAGKRIAGAGLSSDATEIVLTPYTPQTTNDTLYIITGNPASVTFNNNGGDVSPYTVNGVVGFATIENKNGAVPPPNKVFIGWGLTDDATEPIQLPYTPITANNDTLYAIYADEATVSFDINGGKGIILDKKGAVGYATISAPSNFEAIPPDENNQVLAGWGLTEDATEAEKVSFPYTPTSPNVTLYAIYKNIWD